MPVLERIGHGRRSRRDARGSHERRGSLDALPRRRRAGGRGDRARQRDHGRRGGRAPGARRGHVDIQSVESSGIGALAISGSDICWDIDANGCDDGDPNLTQNAPTNTNGDETVQGILTVVDEFRVTGIPEPLEDTLYSFRTASGSGAIPDNDWCYPMFGYATAPIAGRGSDPSGSCEHPLATDLQLTQMCVTFVVGTAPTNNCVLQLYEKGERGTVHASFDVGGTEMDTVGETKCVALNVPIDDAPESLYFQASATANDCDATTNWPELEVLVRGYRVTIP
jgi:hypothetical protein